MTNHRSKYPKIATSRTFIMQIMDSGGGINKTQANLLRLEWPAPDDWHKKILGLKLSHPKRDALLRLKTDKTQKRGKKRT